MIMHFRITHLDRYVGIFMILALIFLTAALVFVAREQKWLEKRYAYRTFFSKVQGLKIGTPVTISGMEVGSVKSFRLNPEGKVEVQLEVLETYSHYLRADSQVSIATALLGGKTVEIGMGSPGQPPAVAGQILPSQEPKDLADLLREIDVQTPLKKVDETLENLKSLTAELKRPDGELFSILKNVQFLAAQLKEGEGTAGAILRDPKLYREMTAAAESVNRSAVQAEGITAKVAEVAKELPAIVDQVNGRIQEIQGILGEIQKAAGKLGPILENVRRATVEAPTIAGNVKEITGDVREITGDVKKTSPELPDLIHQTQQAVEDADKVIAALQNHWLIRGSVPRPRGEVPIEVSQRQNPYEKIQGGRAQ